MISVSEGFIISLLQPRQLGPNFFPHLGTINFHSLKCQEFLILASYFLGSKREKSKKKKKEKSTN